jgi:SM-20-related protein
MGALSLIETAAPACPHIIFRDVLGAKKASDLLDFVVAGRAKFEPALVRNRNSGQVRLDYDLRGSTTTNDLGEFAALVDGFVREIAGPALAQLKLDEGAVEPREFEMNAFGDGSRFGTHVDTSERLTKVRVLSCVYYFGVTPRPFSGGHLRLYAMPTLSAAKGAPMSNFVDVPPDTDTMVVFPSFLRHEVLPVSVPSKAWIDSRFTINCWVCRVR